MSDTQAQSSKALNQLQFSFDPKGRTLAHAILYPTLALGMTSGAQAAIVHMMGPVVGSDNASSAWNIDGTGAAEVTLGDSNAASDFYALNWVAQQPGFDLLVLPSCSNAPVTGPTIVDASGDFGSVCGNPENSTSGVASFLGFHEWGFSAPGGSGTLGFRFDNNGTTNYGIANFTFNNWDGAGPVGDFTIDDWYYNDNGKGIKGDATEAPEPSTAALMVLALGAIGLRRRRRDTTQLH